MRFLSLLLLFLSIFAAVVENDESDPLTEGLLTSAGDSVSGYPTSSRFLQLTKENMVSALTGAHPQILAFFTVGSGCADCAVAASAVSAAADGPLSAMPELSFFYVDCTTNIVLCRVMGQASVPGLRFVRQNGASAELSDVSDFKTAGQIVDWINFMRGPALVPVSTRAELTSAVAKAPVHFILYKPSDAARAVVYRFAAPFKGRVPFVVTSTPEVVSDYGIDALENQLIAVKEGEGHVRAIPGDSGEDDLIARFIYAHYLPELITLDVPTLRDLSALPDRLVVVALHADTLDAQLASALRGVCMRDAASAGASPSAPLPRFACAHAAAADWPDFGRVYGLDTSATGSGVLLALRPSRSQFWVLKDSDIDSWSGIQEWLDRVASGGLDKQAKKIDVHAGLGWGARVVLKLRMVGIYARVLAKEKPLAVGGAVLLLVLLFCATTWIWVKQRGSTKATRELIDNLRAQMTGPAEGEQTTHVSPTQQALDEIVTEHQAEQQAEHEEDLAGDEVVEELTHENK